MKTHEMSVMDFSELPESKRQVAQLEAINAKRVESYEGLREILLDYIHITNLNGSPVRLSVLNRRFYKAAGTYKKTVLAVVSELVREDLVVCHTRKNNTLLMTKRFADELGANIANQASTFEDPVARGEDMTEQWNQFYDNAR